MTNSRFTFLRWLHLTCHIVIPAGILLALGILAIVAYEMVFTDTIHQDSPLTVERARQLDCPIPLPATASRVRFAEYHRWGKNEVYVRFKANSAVCKEWVTTVVEANGKTGKGTSKEIVLRNITSPPTIPPVGKLGPLLWFNINRIIDGCTYSGGPHGPDIWIDDDHDLFYYRLVD